MLHATVEKLPVCVHIRPNRSVKNNQSTVTLTMLCRLIRPTLYDKDMTRQHPGVLPSPQPPPPGGGGWGQNRGKGGAILTPN